MGTRLRLTQGTSRGGTLPAIGEPTVTRRPPRETPNRMDAIPPRILNLDFT